MNFPKVRILHSYPVKEIKFIKSIEMTFDFPNFENTIASSFDRCKLDVSNFDLLVIHYLKKEDIKYLLKNETEIPIIWFAWGMDYYNLGRFRKNLLLPKTSNLYSLILFKVSKIRWFSNLIMSKYPILYDYSSKGRNRIKSIKLIEYIIPVVPTEFEPLIKKYKIHAKLFHPNYVNPIFDDENIDLVKGNNILIGNSAAIANNHMEAIDSLRKIKLDGRKIIIPLNYGGIERFSKEIENYAVDNIGSENLIILKKQLPFDEYNKILLSCNVMIMNHVRQQAFGNILQGILQGIHIYLRPESPIFKYLKSLNITFSVIEDGMQIRGLHNEEIQKNITIIRSIYDPEIHKKRLGKFINEIIHK